MDDPARPNPGSGSLLSLLDLQPPIDEVWAKILALIEGRIALALATYASSSITTVACTMGSPDVPLAVSTKPWASIVIPFYATIERVDQYNVPSTGTASIDIRIVRPGQATSEAQPFYAGDPPSFMGDAVRFPTSSGWMGYVEPGTAILFFVTAASGGIELVTCNLILRTLG